ncbi:hypothetical protein [Actinophytocola oryzae]|uniref:hypothetical protein n=1 Tax=Actinophytocola oryzae TaxID=502181 RepID=UPI00106305AC|nr:hypothetical protein [Actinophytocola oryzae]
MVGLVSASEAAQFGYKPAWYADHARRVADAKSRQEKWSAPMLGVLNGDGPSKVKGVDVPVGGCNAEARRILGRNTEGKPGDEGFVLHLEGTAGQLAEKDSRLRAVFAKWSECMAASGYYYRDPWQANGDPAFGADIASAAEIATATADVACRDKHNVNGVWVALQAAYQDQLIESNADALRRHGSATAGQLRHATNVLAGNR